MKKEDAVNALISGQRLLPRDLMRVSLRGSVVTLRHSWSNRDDGRAIEGLRRMYYSLGQRVANATGTSVEVYGHDGSMLASIAPVFE